MTSQSAEDQKTADIILVDLGETDINISEKVTKFISNQHQGHRYDCYNLLVFVDETLNQIVLKNSKNPRPHHCPIFKQNPKIQVTTIEKFDETIEIFGKDKLEDKAVYFLVETVSYRFSPQYK